uniref:Uncharacterized protein n=1 Tax=Arundo donax TaxID=35708 RepID=A0A0A9H823_ARUDO
MTAAMASRAASFVGAMGYELKVGY